MLAAFCLHQSSYAQDKQQSINAGADFGWHTAYVTEGRDNLNGTNFYVVHPNISYRNWTAEIWYGSGQKGNYQEINTNLFYSWHLKKISITPGITRIDYLHNNRNEYEISLSASYPFLSRFQVRSFSVFSSRTEGTFHKLTLSADYPILETNLRLSPYVSQAFDWGYVTPSYDGLNHFEWGLQARYSINSQWRIQLKAMRVQAQEDMRQQNLGNHNWLSMGFSLSIN